MLWQQLDKILYNKCISRPNKGNQLALDPFPILKIPNIKQNQLFQEIILIYLRLVHFQQSESPHDQEGLLVDVDLKGQG